jgi:hypothetical protein
MTDGAGTGPGLKGKGSQHASDETSTSDASPGSGAVAASPSSGENVPGNTHGKNVGNVEKTPLVVGALVIVLSLSGTLLL